MPGGSGFGWFLVAPGQLVTRPVLPQGAGDSFGVPSPGWGRVVRGQEPGHRFLLCQWPRVIQAGTRPFPTLPGRPGSPLGGVRLAGPCPWSSRRCGGRAEERAAPCSRQRGGAAGAALATAPPRGPQPSYPGRVEHVLLPQSSGSFSVGAPGHCGCRRPPRPQHPRAGAAPSRVTSGQARVPWGSARPEPC